MQRPDQYISQYPHDDRRRTGGTIWFLFELPTRLSNHLKARNCDAVGNRMRMLDIAIKLNSFATYVYLSCYLTDLRRRALLVLFTSLVLPHREYKDAIHAFHRRAPAAIFPFW